MWRRTLCTLYYAVYGAAYKVASQLSYYGHKKSP